MAPSPPGAARTIRLLIGAAMRNWLNRLRGQLTFRWRRGGSSGARVATPRKGATGPWLVAVFGVFALVGVFFHSGRFAAKLSAESRRRDGGQAGRVAVPPRAYRHIVETESDLAAIDRGPAGESRPACLADQGQAAMESLRRTLASEAVLPAMRSGRRPEDLAEEWIAVFRQRGSKGFTSQESNEMLWPSGESWRGTPREGWMLRGFALLVVMIWCSLCMMAFGSANKDLGKVEWRMEWLFTFPVSARLLMAAHALEFAALNSFGWVLFAPLLTVALLTAGVGFWSVPLGVAGAAQLNLMLAGVRLAGETLFRKRLSRSQLKNLQAGFTIVGAVGFVAVMYTVLAEQMPEAFVSAVDDLGGWCLWLPLGLPVLLGGHGALAGALALMVASGAALVGGAILLSARLVRAGLLVEAGPYQGRRSARPAARFDGGMLRGILGKEVRLLLRDRSFMAQTLVVPIIMVVFQVLLNRPLLRAASADLRHAAAIAFGIGAYVLMFGAFHVLSAEGKSLWLLYTFPRRLEDLMRRKALLWAGVGSAYTFAVVVASMLQHPSLSPTAAANAALAVAGVFVFAFIAAGIGMMGTDPLAQEVHRKIRPTSMYMYMILAGMYAAGMYAPSMWGKLVALTLTGLIAYAIWQKVRDRAPLLLDPTAVPPPRIALSDGLIAAFAFFAVQTLVFVILVHADSVAPGGRLAIAYVAAGAAVTVVSLLLFAARKVPDVLAATGLRAGGPGGASASGRVLFGVAMGVVAGSVGLVYLRLVDLVPALRDLKEETLRMTSDLGAGATLWIAALAILAAPVFEEYVFRGLVFRGLRRSWGFPVAALASAAIFAVIHQPVAVIPVFGLAMAAAWSFERAGTLAAPIATHVTYNALVMTVPILWSHPA